ncbi:hypothetical protein D7D52_22065 [Nocardia yunnanensis]|uniref:Uncharacterized protein n=1 Tax=Nocardia yunnanensis TaxID=2382165 RepID=A0A386ZF83_9NOCA|nr:hypothetical protein D7D52_22065 [Nocardia yunnanensis]
MPAPLAQLCNAVIDLLERTGHTNKQILAATELPMSPQTLTRYLLGQNKTPLPAAVVEQLVDYAATALRTDPDTLYTELPVLREHAGPHLSSKEVAHRERLDSEVLERAGWLWELIMDGREHLAAVALDGVFLSDPPAIGQALLLIAANDRGAADALLYATAELYGPDRAAALAALVWPPTGTEQSPTQYTRTPPPEFTWSLWQPRHKELFTKVDASPQIGRRLNALIRRLDVEPAAAELAALVSDSGADTALAVLYGIAYALPRKCKNDGFVQATMVLDAMAADPEYHDAVHAIMTALLTAARAQSSHQDRDRLIEGLADSTLDFLLERFGRVLVLNRSSAAYANLRDLLNAISDNPGNRDNRKVLALLRASESDSAVHILAALNHDQSYWLARMAATDTPRTTVFITTVAKQSLHRGDDASVELLGLLGEAVLNLNLVKPVAAADLEVLMQVVSYALSFNPRVIEGDLVNSAGRAFTRLERQQAQSLLLSVFSGPVSKPNLERVWQSIFDQAPGRARELMKFTAALSPPLASFLARQLAATSDRPLSWDAVTHHAGSADRRAVQQAINEAFELHISPQQAEETPPVIPPRPAKTSEAQATVKQPPPALPRPAATSTPAVPRRRWWSRL